jgi:hypothetical protein
LPCLPSAQPDDPELCLSVVALNPYQVSRPHFPSHSRQVHTTATDATCDDGFRELIAADAPPSYAEGKIASVRRSWVRSVMED